MTKKTIITISALFLAASLTSCGKEDGTKYEYAENLIYEEDDTSIKLLNSTESEEELKLKFALENFETEDVKVTVYDPENNEITEGVECSYDEENSIVSIKGDISQVDTAEVDLNYTTSLKVKDLKNEEFKYLLTNYEDDHGCTYLGDLDDFQVNEKNEASDSEDGEEADGEGGVSADGEEKKPGGKKRMSKEEIFDLLKGKWKSDDNAFELEFASGTGEEKYHVKASGEGADNFDSSVSYFDETKTENEEHKIRFVTESSGYGSCRELILSADGKSMSYIAGIRKNADDQFEEIYINCHK